MARNGLLNRCPVCRAALWAEVGPPLGHKRCPRCGAELWVVVFSEGPVFFPRRPGESLYDLLAAVAGPQLGLSASEIEAALKDADSFDVVEFVSEVEEAVRSCRP
jgi:hypothetical protein